MQFLPKYSIPPVLIIIIFLTFGIPHAKISYYGDSCGDILHARTGTVSQFFTEGSAYDAHVPANVQPVAPSFTASIYRPLSFCYLKVQYYLWGNAPYCFFLVSVLLHALCCVLLFLLLSWLVAWPLALLGACMLAYHPSVAVWLNWISMQQYLIDALLFMVLCSLLIYAHRRRSFITHIGACALYAHSLLLKEQLFVLPIVLVVLVPLYWNLTQHRNVLTWHNLRDYGRLVPGFLLVSFGYLYLRSLVLPMTVATTVTGGTVGSLGAIYSLAKHKARLLEFVSLMSDTLGLAWLPADHRLLKGSCIFVLLALIVILVRHTRSYVLALLTMMAFGALSWPSVLLCHRERYLYLGLWLLILVLIVLVDRIRLVKVRTGVIVFLWLMVSVHACWSINQLNKNVVLTQWVTQRYQLLVSEYPQVLKRALCFYNIQPPLYDLAQTVPMLIPEHHQPVYVVSAPEVLEVQFLATDPLFITWDSSTEKFVVKN